MSFNAVVLNFVAHDWVTKKNFCLLNVLNGVFMHLINSWKILTWLWKNNLYLKCFDFLQVFVLSFLYFALFTFHIFFFTKLNMKTQFEIEFLPPNNGSKKVLEKYTGRVNQGKFYFSELYLFLSFCRTLDRFVLAHFFMVFLVSFVIGILFMHSTFIFGEQVNNHCLKLILENLKKTCKRRNIV